MRKYRDVHSKKTSSLALRILKKSFIWAVRSLFCCALHCVQLCFKLVIAQIAIICYFIAANTDDLKTMNKLAGLEKNQPKLNLGQPYLLW